MPTLDAATALLDCALMRPLLLLAVSLATSACGLFYPPTGDEADDGGITVEEVYVAVGDGGTLLSSPDGATWTRRTVGTDLTLHDVAFGGDRYVAVGQAGKIVESIDGIEWRVAFSPSSRDLHAVVHHFDHFVAVGGDYSVGAETLESIDGITWTRPEGAAPLHLLTDLASDGVSLVAIGNYQSDTQTFGAFRWVDGVGWEQTVDGGLANFGFNAVAAGAPAFAMIGLGNAVTSVDGANWSFAPIFQSSAMRALTFAGAGWIAVGDAGQVLLSPDAAQWTPYTSGVAVDLGGVASDGSLHIAVGGAGTILASGDGVTWIAQVSGATENLHAVMHPRG